MEPQAIVRRPSFGAILRRHWMIYLMLVPAAIWLLVFSFYPLWGLAVAFVDYDPFKGVLGSEFVGLGIFQRFFNSPNAPRLIRNTIMIALGKIVVGQAFAVVFALTLNQVRIPLYKRAAQTFTILTHFLSWVLIGGVLRDVLSETGIFNRALVGLGGSAIRFFGSPPLFPFTLIGTETWKEFGWGAVIYLAALTAINPELYEAAAVEGAGRWTRMLHISIPGIKPIIILMSCLSLGSILNAGFEQILVLGNPIVYSTGDVIDTFVYRIGLLEARWSLATAVGVFKSLIGFAMVLLSYWLADRLANYRIL